MTDDYKKGLVTGLAMQPLYVATAESGGGDGECYCAFNVLHAVATNDVYCRIIADTEV